MKTSKFPTTKEIRDILRDMHNSDSVQLRKKVNKVDWKLFLNVVFIDTMSERVNRRCRRLKKKRRTALP